MKLPLDIQPFNIVTHLLPHLMSLSKPSAFNYAVTNLFTFVIRRELMYLEEGRGQNSWAQGSYCIVGAHVHATHTITATLRCNDMHMLHVAGHCHRGEWHHDFLQYISALIKCPWSRKYNQYTSPSCSTDCHCCNTWEPYSCIIY